MKVFRNIRTLLASALFVGMVLGPESAHALDLAVMGSLNIGTQSQAGLAATYTAGTVSNFGYGALLAFDSFPTIKSEFGILSVKRGMALTSSTGGTSTSTYNYLMVPYMFRFEPISLISVGAGAYYAYGMGNYNVTSTIPGLASADATYEAGGYSRSDFGLIAGISLKFPVLPLFSVRLDADYALGLSNLYSSSAGNATFRDILLMAGLNFGF